MYVYTYMYPRKTVICTLYCCSSRVQSAHARLEHAHEKVGGPHSTPPTFCVHSCTSLEELASALSSIMTYIYTYILHVEFLSPKEEEEEKKRGLLTLHNVLAIVSLFSWLLIWALLLHTYVLCWVSFCYSEEEEEEEEGEGRGWQVLLQWRQKWRQFWRVRDREWPAWDVWRTTTTWWE